MGHHFTRNTVSAPLFCNKCEKVTQHRVDDRRAGPCIPCMERQEAEVRERQAKEAAMGPAAEQGRLF